jgi:hypothetical protein
MGDFFVSYHSWSLTTNLDGFSKWETHFGSSEFLSFCYPSRALDALVFK